MFSVPNKVHYVLFNRSSLNFVFYLSLMSVLKIQKPLEINIHSDREQLSGYYWDLLRKIDTNTSIKLNYMAQPTHTYGQRLSSIYHVSDVARIHILQTAGGIYLDNDVIVVNSLDKLRRFDMVVGCPDDENIGTQVTKKNLT